MPIVDSNTLEDAKGGLEKRRLLTELVDNKDIMMARVHKQEGSNNSFLLEVVYENTSVYVPLSQTSQSYPSLIVGSDVSGVAIKQENIFVFELQS